MIYGSSECVHGVDRLAKRSYAVVTQIEGRQHYLLQPQLSIPKHYQLLP